MPPSLLVDLQTLVMALALIAPRALLCLTILPGFITRNLPGLARHAVAVAIALPAVLPTFLFLQQTPPDPLLTVALAGKEALLGAMFGVLLSTPLWVAQSLGSVLDVQRSPIHIPATGAQEASATGMMLQQAVIIAMVQAGLFVALTRILVESYGIWPAFELMPPFEHGHFDVVLKRLGELFWHLIVYGAPVLIPLVLIDLAFAVIGVFTPHLQVSFASSPIKCLVGLFVMLLYWPTFSHYVAGDFARLLDFSAVLMQAGGSR
jgi:type III secretion protein T